MRPLRRGTRFRIFPQSPHLEAFSQPETVWLDPPPGSIRPGPADRRLYVVDPLHKPQPYDQHYLPPFHGPIHPGAFPDRNGHFDHLELGTRAFNAAHMYAVIRCVLEIWEGYFARPVPWHFRDRYARLELIPYVDWENAQSGYGFIEAGYDTLARGDRTLHCLNFDVLAHELGHSLIYSVVGIPSLAGRTNAYFAFHETAADLTALIACLHFESVVDHLLAGTEGNLYALNELNRIGERSEIEQIRLASNIFKMSNFINGWKTEHYLSLPLTGAIFDIMIDVYQRHLLALGLIDAQLAALSFEVPDPALDYQQLQSAYSRAYQHRHEGFKTALLEARDYAGRCLALAWQQLSPENFDFRHVPRALLSADRVLSGGAYQIVINDNFAWREIGRIAPGPRSDPAGTDEVRGCRG